MDSEVEQSSLISVLQLDKAELADSRGVTYKEFKRDLKPQFGVLWFELLAGHFVLILTIIAMIKLESIKFLLPITVMIGAFIFGLAHAYIQLYFHEAAHGNIAKDRKTNDFLANLFIGIFIGQDIKVYRPIHFMHHQKLGTTDDSERTYFDALNLRFIIESLTGIKVVKVLLGRKSSVQSTKQNAPSIQKNKLINKQLMLGMLLHLTLLCTAIACGHYVLAFAWVLGVGLVLPFFMAVRQVLEHRDIEAKSYMNFHKVPHGSVHRLFGDSLLARIIGGAGFNRHLLHHWEPQISCTQLRRLEEFLLETSAAHLILSAKTTYTSTFIRLMRAS